MLQKSAKVGIKSIIRRNDPVLGWRVNLRPEETLIHVGPGRDFALQSRRSDAADAYAKVIQNCPFSSDWFEYAYHPIASACMMVD